MGEKTVRDGCKTGNQTKGAMNGDAPARLKWGEGRDTAKKLSDYLKRKGLNTIYKPR